jgi:methyltransferase-like protein/2-polyprenyl-3-methyl-5-hydroxy-6-metoxy-1,4-benzoquinol methylase
MTDAARPYDEFGYPSYPHVRTHPARLGAVGRLLGLDPAAAGSCRTLELGCGDGTNLIAMAAALPGSRFVGVDAAARPIAAGNELVRAAGLTNVELRELDLERLPPDLGQFDYVVAHGVYSWVPASTRTALLAACGQLLAPHGVALVSYNAYPGSHLRDMTGRMLAFHLRDLTDAAEMVSGAREFIEAVEATGVDSPEARALRDQMARLAGAGDALLYHDDLARVNAPVYFHEFMKDAGAHGLQFLSEADPSTSRLSALAPATRRLLQSLPDDVVVREQYLDFLTNRMFRSTLLCREHAPVRRSLRAADVESLAVAAPVTAVSGAVGRFEARNGGTIESREPFVQAALRVLGAEWPVPLEFGALAARAEERGTRASEAQVGELEKALLYAWMGGVVDLWSEPPPVARHPGERPVASPLARAQVESGATAVSTLVHATVVLGAVERRAIGLLDGARRAESLESEFPGVLERLAAAGLLLGER